MLKVSIIGAAGRMGQALLRAIDANPGATLVGAVDLPDHPNLGQDAFACAGLPACGVALTSNTLEAVVKADVVIEFSRPDSTMATLALCAQEQTAMLIGTTGFSESEQAQIRATQAPLLMAANYSLGVTLALKLVEMASGALSGWDIEIVEAHHKHKVDAPSGTALALGHAAANGRGVSLADVRTDKRSIEQAARTQGSIGFAAMRGGDIVGEHTVYLVGEGERVEITHRAMDRGIFAAGAVNAAIWLARQPTGLYDMHDVLGLR